MILPATYDPAFFDRLARIEEQHAWFRTRNRVIADVVAQLGAGQPDFRVLEVGCGTGGALAALRTANPGALLAGMDVFREGLGYACLRTDALLVTGDAMRPPFGPAFDVVGLFDVFEHLPDDVAALRALWAMLAPGGALLLTVPADPALWSYFDEAARHVRRYTEETLAAALREGGFRVEYLSSMMRPLRPLLAAYRRLAWLRVRSAGAANAAWQDLQVLPVINPVMTAVLGRERERILRRERLAGGTSLIAIARPEAP